MNLHPVSASFRLLQGVVLLCACLSGRRGEAVEGAPARRESRVLRALENFERGSQQAARPGLPVQVSRVQDPLVDGSCLQVVIPGGFSWRWKGWNGDADLALPFLPVANVCGPFLQPEADAVRARVWVRSGRAVLAVGGPVSQMGCSDVWCEPQLFEAGGGWQTVEFSLNHSALRNFRRANFTRDLPVAPYTRWAQEPLQLYVLAPAPGLQPAGETVVWVDSFELVSRGEGRPFPRFAAGDVRLVGRMADFSGAAPVRDAVWTVGHAYSVVDSFRAGYLRGAAKTSLPEVSARFQKTSPFIREEGLLYPAPRYTRVRLPDGDPALRVEGVWAEEGQIVTFKTAAPPEANAVRVRARVRFPDMPAQFVAHLGPGAPRALDFVAFVSPRGAGDFPWVSFGPSAELRAALERGAYTGPGERYDFLLVPQKNDCLQEPDVRRAGAFGFYSSRRLFEDGEWQEWIVPFADFLCVYGQGECAAWQGAQAALAPDRIAAFGLVAPFGSGHGEILVGEVSFVWVPESSQGLRSYWQSPVPAKLERHRLPERDWLWVLSEGPVPSFLGESRKERRAE